jgi:hypothetical protein
MGRTPKETKMENETKIEQAVAAMFNVESEAAEEVIDGMLEMSSLEATTFEEAGVMTSNRGVVVRIGRCEYQITIVRSR